MGWSAVSTNSRSTFDLPAKDEERERLEALTARPDFWDNPDRARNVSGQIAGLKAWTQPIAELHVRLGDARALVEMAEEEGGEAAEEAVAELSGLEEALRGLELRKMLSGKDDERNAIVAVHPGAGGTDSQDWAQMLFRMYVAWASRRGFEVETIDIQPADEAGIKSATAIVRGPYAYGYLRAEIGVHRLVRLSPFDAAHRRHTSFASMAAYPEIDDTIEIEISDADVRMDVFRASGPGGQHV
ncbi:PCRF domain-containing protein, partial [bacterium]|nr:PCRF domain-containing protein [bacterium]